MKFSPRSTGILLLVVHLLLVACIGLQYAYDKATLPRVWVKVLWTKNPGGYVTLRPCPVTAPYGKTFRAPVRLKITPQGLVAEPGTRGDRVEVMRDGTQPVPCLYGTMPFYAGDAGRIPAGREIWAEYLIPRNADPRPLRLGVKEPQGVVPIE